MRAKLAPNTVFVEFPTPDHPSGKLVLRLTGILWETPAGAHGCAPHKRCKACGQLGPVPSFLKHAVIGRDGYMRLSTSDRCRKCEPPTAIPIHCDASGRLRIRLELRGEHEEPVRWFDGKTRRWRAFDNLGLRRLAPGGNVVTNQPYADRQHSWDGKPYAKP